MAFQSLYDILGVEPSASAEDIKDAYRRQAMKWHPDRNPNNRAEAEDRFKQIGYAYKALSDPQRRAAYDADLASQRASSAGQQQRERASSGPGMSEDDAATMFFEQMLDLAYEIARRGYAEEAIYKALVGLDCPESIARTVAEATAKGAQQEHRAQNANASEYTRQGGYTSQNEYAGFWARAAASMVDGIVGAMLYLPLLLVLAYASGGNAAVGRDHRSH